MFLILVLLVLQDSVGDTLYYFTAIYILTEENTKWGLFENCMTAKYYHHLHSRNILPVSALCCSDSV